MRNFEPKFISHVNGRLVKMLASYFLVVFIYHILKDLKDTLVITSSSFGAETIPFLKLWFMLPAAFLVTYLITKGLGWFGKFRLFCICVTLLSISYIIFGLAVFPNLKYLQLGAVLSLYEHLPTGLGGLVAAIYNWPVSIFYILAELWSIVILSFFFWTIAHDITSFDEAQSHFPLYSAFGSAAGMFSGLACSHLSLGKIPFPLFNELSQWQQSICAMVALTGTLSCLLMLIMSSLAPQLENGPKEKLKKERSKNAFTLRETLSLVIKNKYIRYLTICVLGYNVTMNVMEVIWKSHLKEHFLDSGQLNAFVNQTTFFVGLLSGGLSLFAPYLMRRFAWKTMALIPPIMLLITSALFFFAHQFHESVGALLGLSTSLVVPVTFGAILMISCKTIKYTIFDSCKEIAFIPLDKKQRTQGKAVIDMLATRFGKSAPSVGFQLLFLFFGTVANSAFIMILIVLLVLFYSLVSTNKLGEMVKGLT